MKTSKPLKELIPEILVHINEQYESVTVYNSKLIDIMDGQLLKYVEKSLEKELSPHAYEKSKERIAPINILDKLKDKLSKIYCEPAERLIDEENDKDKELFDKYLEWFSPDVILQSANEFLTINKYCAIEPYIVDGKPALRVMGSDKFLPFSDSKVDPTQMTVFIKFTGLKPKEQSIIMPVVDEEGNAVANTDDVVKMVHTFVLYSDNEIMSIDDTGHVLSGSHRTNPVGRIPFLYLKTDPNKLIPIPASDLMAMAVLIPKLLTDVNYAIQFLSHSIMYGIDVDASDLDNNPDAFWILKSTMNGDGTTTQPQIGTVKPEVDSDKVTEAIKFQVGLWLDSKGISTSGVSNIDTSNAASAISKMVDEGDATSINKKTASLFVSGEKELWELTRIMHGIWLASKEIDPEHGNFSEDFAPSCKHVQQQVFVDTSKVLEDLKKEFEMGLITIKGALRRLNPKITDDQLEELLTELEEFAKTSTDKDLLDQVINLQKEKDNTTRE